MGWGGGVPGIGWVGCDLSGGWGGAGWKGWGRIVGGWADPSGLGVVPLGMRVFWVILIVAGLGGLAVLLLPSNDGRATTPSAAAEPAVRPEVPAPRAAAPVPDPVPGPSARPEAEPEPVVAARPEPTPEPTPDPTPEPMPEPERVAEAPVAAPAAPEREIALAEPVEAPVEIADEPMGDDPAAGVPVAEGPTPALGLDRAGDAVGELLASLNAFGRAMGAETGAEDAEASAGEGTGDAETASTTEIADATPTRTLDDALQALNESNATMTEPEADPAAGTAVAQAEVSLPIDATIEKDDGTLEIGGGEWVLPGDGTTAKPYIISWDLLQSAMQVYNPRLGKTELPEWAQKLNGKRVRVEGYVVLPLAQQSSNDILLTLNQWDGCCLGVPPTPYDAIEVRLTGAVDAGPGAGMGPVYGSVEGDFKVDPYVAGGWLLGLYVLEEGKLTLMGRR